jgi:hypothetical protein
MPVWWEEGMDEVQGLQYNLVWNVICMDSLAPLACAQTYKVAPLVPAVRFLFERRDTPPLRMALRYFPHTS